MARKAGVAFAVLGQAYLSYKYLYPDEPDDDAPDDSEPVWRVVRGNIWAYQTPWVHQLSKPTGNLIDPKRQVVFECSLGSNDYDKGLLCYIGSQPGVDEDTFALALDHIEAEASKSKPTKLVFDFEDGYPPRHHRKQLKKRGYVDDVLDPRNEWSRFVLGKVLA